NWMPDTRVFGRTNWLELEYAAPQAVDKISIYGSQQLNAIGSIALIGTSGTNLMVIPISSGALSHGGSTGPARTGGRVPDWVREYSIPATSQPVKTLRLNFEKTAP